MTDKESVFVFCAHSDDQILGPGGAIAKYAREGIDVYTIIFSYGENSHPWMQGHVTAKIRVKEAHAADKVIKGKAVRFLGLKEGKFRQQFQERGLYVKIRNLLREKKPSKIFTHSWNDPLPDHKAVHNIVTELVMKLRNIPDVYSFDIWNPIALQKTNVPKLIVDISHTFKFKVKALLCFKSQKLSVYQILPRVFIKNLLAGLNYGMKYAEVFHKVDIHGEIERQKYPTKKEIRKRQKAQQKA